MNSKLSLSYGPLWVFKLAICFTKLLNSIDGPLRISQMYVGVFSINIC